jgi:putative DNA primase/helicase
MHEDPWCFDPTFKLVMHGQFRPNVRGDDEGTWGRMQALEWEVSFKGREDKQLKEKLRNELDGILADSVRGCLEWQDKGLAPPGAVAKATEEYRTESDKVGAYIKSHLVFEPEARVTARDVRMSYELFCSESGEHPVGARRFWSRARRAGIAVGVEIEPIDIHLPSNDGKTHKVNGYRHVRLNL